MKKKLLWISDSSRLPFIGQSIVSRECLERLREWYDVEMLGYADADAKEHIEVPYKVIPCQRSDFGNVDTAAKYITESNPDVVLFSHDIWLLPIIPYLRARFPKIKWMTYLTVDGEPAFYRWRSMLKAYDKIIVQTQFAKTTLLDKWIDLDIDVVPYGLNHEVFHPPKQSKAQLKYDLTCAQNTEFFNMHNKFMAIYIGANQDRKNLGLMHEAWREFEKDKHDVIFFMFVHSASLKEDMGSYDLMAFTHDTKHARIIPQPQPLDVIGKFMAASDVLLHPSAGEGWGMSITEAMASGTVPIAMRYAGATEFLTEENCYSIPFILHVGGYHVHRALSTQENVTQLLQKAYSDKNDRLQRAVKGIEAVKDYTWENTANGLRRNIEEVLARPANSLVLQRIV